MCLAAGFPGNDVVRLALAGRFPATDACAVAGDQGAALGRSRRPAGDGLVQRCEVCAAQHQRQVGAAEEPIQRAGRDGTGAGNLGNAAGLAQQRVEIGPHDT